MRRILCSVLAGVGVILLVLGVLLTTVWRSNQQIEASWAGQSQYVYTEPGVLDMGSERVKVSASSTQADTEITVAFGYCTDVSGWVDGLSRTALTGMKNATTLAAKDEPASVEGSFDLAGADNWLAVHTGKKNVNVEYDVATRGEICMVATTAASAAPKITLAWPQSQMVIGVPVILFGIFFLVLPVLLILVWRHRDAEEAQARERTHHELVRQEQRSAAETAVLTRIEGGDITHMSRKVQVAGTGRALGAGVVMTSPRAAQLRAQPLLAEARLVIDSQSEVEDLPATSAFKHRWEVGSKPRVTSGSLYRVGAEVDGIHADIAEPNEPALHDEVAAHGEATAHDAQAAPANDGVTEDKEA